MEFESIWDAIEDDPEQILNMKIKSYLMMEVEREVSERKLNQGEASALLGATQSQLTNLMDGKINEIGFDDLVSFVRKLGMSPLIPNEDTIKAMKDATTGKLDAFDTVSELFLDAGIDL